MSACRALYALGLLVSSIVCASSAKASFPLAGALPKEQKIILLCGVDNAMMAKDCAPGIPSPSVNKRILAFIQVETNAPDYLAGATPGSHVLVMIRRSTAEPLDAVNPGRALAAEAPAPQSVNNPEWALMPNARDLDGYFPEKALRMSTSGSANVRCTVGAQGDLLGCWVADEIPSGFGFAPAALLLTTFIQLKPMTKDGAPTVGHSYNLHAAFDARNGKIMLSNGP